ncbi:hypothetical protein [Fulvivirga sedimenti]|uniref:DNA primase n=1 Tax=Fulvivirga sedimenti TaxID=2879465 RepID=A0A9X1HX17_9BACT|nr:hypothetical protein [Fulvivirga sedimenti]MCA6078623.1 hypothetical protein [Fulvivirga sedimenti]
MNRVIKSLENLSPELRKIFKKQYPDGFEDSIMRITNQKNEPIFVVPLNTDDTNYLIKIAMVRNSDGEYDLDVENDEIDNDDDPAFGVDDDDADFDD